MNKKVIISTMLLLHIGIAKSQNCSTELYDTLSLTIDNEIIINLAVTDLWKADTVSIFSNIRKLDSTVVDNHESVPFKYYQVIDYGKSIQYVELEEEDILELTDSGLIQNQKPILIRQCRRNYTVIIKLRNIQSISKSDFYSKLSAVIDTLSKEKKLLGIPEYHYVGSSLIIERSNTNVIALSLYPLFGLDVIKNKLVTSITFVASVDLITANINRGRVGSSYTLHTIFTENGTLQFNNFLSVFYGFNRSKDIKNESWREISLGYTVRRNGTLFDKNTIRLGLSSMHKRVKVTGFVYYPGKWNRIYPGIGILIK